MAKRTTLCLPTPKMAISNFKFQILNSLAKQELGFTLIELIISFAIISILSGVGIASFFSYSRTQELTNATKDIKTFLTTARTDALAQVKQTTSTNNCGPNSSINPIPTFLGYEVIACCSGTYCASCHNANSDNYELDMVCSNGSGTYYDVVASKKYPDSNVGLSNKVAISSNSTSTSFFFNALSGAVSAVPGAGGNIRSGAGTIVLTGYGQTQQVTVTQTGVIE